MGFLSKYTGELVESAIHEVYNNIYNKEYIDNTINKIESTTLNSIKDIEEILGDPWIVITNE